MDILDVENWNGRLTEMLSLLNTLGYQRLAAVLPDPSYQRWFKKFHTFTHVVSVKLSYDNRAYTLEESLNLNAILPASKTLSAKRYYSTFYTQYATSVKNGMKETEESYRNLLNVHKCNAKIRLYPMRKVAMESVVSNTTDLRCCSCGNDFPLIRFHDSQECYNAATHNFSLECPICGTTTEFMIMLSRSQLKFTLQSQYYLYRTIFNPLKDALPFDIEIGANCTDTHGKRYVIRDIISNDFTCPTYAGRSLVLQETNSPVQNTITGAEFRKNFRVIQSEFTPQHKSPSQLFCPQNIWDVYSNASR